MSTVEPDVDIRVSNDVSARQIVQSSAKRRNLDDYFLHLLKN